MIFVSLFGCLSNGTSVCRRRGLRGVSRGVGFAFVSKRVQVGSKRSQERSQDGVTSRVTFTFIVVLCSRSRPGRVTVQVEFRRNYHATRPHVTGLASDSPSIRRDNSRIKHGFGRRLPPRPSTDARRDPGPPPRLLAVLSEHPGMYTFPAPLLKGHYEAHWGFRIYLVFLVGVVVNCCFNILT